MAESKRSIKLTSLDDLFSTEESRTEADKERIQDIPIAEIDDFPDHPFHVDIDDAMREMAESVKRFGVLSPAVARQKENGRYELISGHRRKKACELAGIDKMPVLSATWTETKRLSLWWIPTCNVNAFFRVRRRFRIK